MASSANPSLGPSRNYPTDALFPKAPNFMTCHESYGTAINVIDCIYALDMLPPSNERVVYHLNDTLEFSNQDGNTMFALPQQRRHGSCTVSLNISPLNFPPTTRPIIQANVWGIAAGVVKRCVDDGTKGIGGFVTWGLQTMVSHINSPDANLGDSMPPSAAFVTVAITGVGGNSKSPGDYDPMIPLKLYESQRDAKSVLPPSNTDPLSKIYLAMSLANGDSSIPWWNLLPSFLSQPASSPDEMTYQCDANLGAPTQFDCTRLEYSQFGSPSDTVIIGIDRPKVLSLNTCNLLISSSTSILLTWAQIGAALNALIGICITGPVGPVKGGRAFYGSQAFSPQSKIRKKRGKQTVSGLNALPPGVNITLSQHG